MAGHNVDRFHRIRQEWQEHRKLSPDLLAEHVEWINPDDALERGSRKGIDSFNEAITSVFDAWDDVRFETDRIFESGDDVIALGHVRGRGHSARIEVSRPHGQIWTFREGRVVRMRWFHSHPETLETAGLRE